MTEVNPLSQPDSSPAEKEGSRAKPVGHGITRRRLLKLTVAGLASIFISPAVKVGLDQEFQAGIGAALTRPDQTVSGEKHEVSLSVLLEVWKKHFQGKEHLLPEEVWVRGKDTYQGKKLEGSGVHLSVLARNCYEYEKADQEDFDAYYIRFIDSLHDLSDLAGLDFITLVASLQISAENISGFEKPKEESTLDVNVSRAQEMVITGARVLGLELDLIRSLGPNGLFIQAKNQLLQLGVIFPKSIDEAVSKEGIRDYDLIRFREQPTIGMMDMEPSERSSAFILFQEGPLAQQLEKDYPEVASMYRKANEKRNAVQKTKEKMRVLADDYIEKYSHRLKPFADGDAAALDVIGISTAMDSWQLQNYTDVWYKISEIPTNPEYTYQRTVESMIAEGAKDSKSFYRKLFSQQIRNPKFMSYLINQALGEAKTEELKQLLDIQNKLLVYDQESKQLRTAYLNVLQAEGPYEYDSKFQQMTSVLVTNRLSKIAGDFKQDDRDSLGWHIYKVCAIREIAPITLLVNDNCYARDITVDPPYAQDELAESLDTFASMLVKAAILKDAPDNDISIAYNTFEKLYWRDGGVWPSVPAAEWRLILDYFNTKLVNRLFYDFAGLLHNEQIMPQLNSLMLDKGLISKPADQDPYNFFTQTVYLMLNSWHMRRDIPRSDWDEVEQFFQENIMPMAYTKTESAPGIFEEKWHIGSADYPPIFRAQAVMYNFLYDKNPNTPHTPSSSELFGHH